MVTFNFEYAGTQKLPQLASHEMVGMAPRMCVSWLYRSVCFSASGAEIMDLSAAGIIRAIRCYTLFFLLLLF